MTYKLLSPKEFAAKYGLNERSTRTLCIDGKLPAVKLGKSWRIDEGLIWKDIKLSGNTIIAIAGEEIKGGESCIIDDNGIAWKVRK